MQHCYRRTQEAWRRLQAASTSPSPQNPDRASKTQTSTQGLKSDYWKTCAHMKLTKKLENCECPNTTSHGHTHVTLTHGHHEPYHMVNSLHAFHAWIFVPKKKKALLNCCKFTYKFKQIIASSKTFLLNTLYQISRTVRVHDPGGNSRAWKGNPPAGHRERVPLTDRDVTVAMCPMEAKGTGLSGEAVLSRGFSITCA